jgi:hypothetical protein
VLGHRVTDCSAMRVAHKIMMHVLHEEHALSNVFVAYLLGQNIRSMPIWWTIFSTPAKKDWPESC